MLSQLDQGKDRPIANVRDHKATIEKEMLEIGSDLDNLLYYLYGADCIKVFTDNLTLTLKINYSVGSPEYDCESTYKPGRWNVVADALPSCPRAMPIPWLQYTARLTRHLVIYSMYCSTRNKKKYSCISPHSGYIRHLILIEYPAKAAIRNENEI